MAKGWYLMAGDILERIRGAEKLPSLPKVVVDILCLTQDPNTSAEEVASILQNDPALTAKVLRVVNSSLFSPAREISSIRQAVALLGMRSIRALALSFALIDLMGRDHVESFDYQLFWNRSLTSAVVARALAKEAGVRLADDAFVAGLLSNLGMLAACHCAPEIVSAGIESNESELRFGDPEAERRAFGASRAEMARALLEAWELPDSLCNAIGAFLGEGLEALNADDRDLALALHFADALSSVFVGERSESDLIQIREETSKALNLTDDRFDDLMQSLHVQVQQAARNLSISIGDTVSYEMLQEQAVSQLATMALQAEMELHHTHRREIEANQRIAKLQEEKFTILEVASTDGLTGIPNRAAFEQRYREEWRRAESTEQPMSLILIDLDHFKMINDRHGHRAGDAVLREVARRIDRETAIVGFAARYGGEEFAVIAPAMAMAEACALAERIRGAITVCPVEFENRVLAVTASAGVATTSRVEPDVTSEQLVEFADQCLYQAKANGRNRVEATVAQAGSRRRSA